MKKLNYLDFEEPIAEFLEKVEALKQTTSSVSLDVDQELIRFNREIDRLTQKIFDHLTPWQRIQLSRHPLRPHSSDYIKNLFSDFQELHGDRMFADDPAIIGGIGFFENRPVMILGQEKGRTIEDRKYRNYGMMHPEGYRKAKRLALLAEKFKLPIISFIDTPGAYPGIEAEERGQSEAIASNLQLFSALQVPIIVIIIGEGCSGGALGIGVGDKTLMLEFSYYATISPEGCASILFKSAQQAPQAAAMMGITPDILLERGLVDSIVPEPLGGAHRNPVLMYDQLRSTLHQELNFFTNKDINTVIAQRKTKLLGLGNDHILC